jgi:hypothetical protein
MNALSSGDLPGSGGRDEDCDPHVAVSAVTIGEAAGILALAAGAAAAGPAVRPALAGPGAGPAHAMSWLVTRAAGLGGALAAGGISIDPVLDRYRGAGAGR